MGWKLRRLLPLAALSIAGFCAAEAPTPAGLCGRGFTVERLVAAMTADKSYNRVDSRDLLSYFVYQGLAEGSEAPCVKLAKLEGPSGKKPWDEMCRTIYYELAFARGLAVQDPDLPKLCRQSVATDEDFALLDQSKIADSCGKADFRRIPETCDRFAAMFTRAEAAKTHHRLCLRFLRSLELGDDTECANSTDPEDVFRCRQYVAFHRARAAGDKKLCAEGEICLAFMGEGRRISRSFASRLEHEACRPGADHDL